MLLCGPGYRYDVAATYTERCLGFELFASSLVITIYWAIGRQDADVRCMVLCGSLQLLGVLSGGNKHGWLSGWNTGLECAIPLTMGSVRSLLSRVYETKQTTSTCIYGFRSHLGLEHGFWSVWMRILFMC